MIRIQTFSWTTYSYTTQILSSISTGLYSWTILLSVTSMKSIFFTLTNTANPNNVNYEILGFEHCGLKQYHILIGGLPLQCKLSHHTEQCTHHSHAQQGDWCIDGSMVRIRTTQI